MKAINNINAYLNIDIVKSEYYFNINNICYVRLDQPKKKAVRSKKSTPVADGDYIYEALDGFAMPDYYQPLKEKVVPRATMVITKELYQTYKSKLTQLEKDLANVTFGGLDYYSIYGQIKKINDILINSVIENAEEVIPEVSTKEKIIENFIKNYSANPGIIKGIIINEKLFTSSDQLSITDIREIRTKGVKYLIKVFYIKDGKVRFKYHIRNSIENYGITSKDKLSILPLIFKAKVKSELISGEIFGKAPVKAELIGTYIDNWNIVLGTSKKLGTSTYYAQVFAQDKSTLKFMLDDIEFINPELKGYRLKKSKTMVVGDFVTIKPDNNYNITSLRGKIISIKLNNSSKRLPKSQNRRKDIVTVRLDNGQVTTVYAQDLKKEENEFIKDQKTISFPY